MFNPKSMGTGEERSLPIRVVKLGANLVNEEGQEALLPKDRRGHNTLSVLRSKDEADREAGPKNILPRIQRRHSALFILVTATEYSDEADPEVAHPKVH